MNYDEYIRSPEWVAKKAEFFASGCYRSKQCYVCQKPWQDGFHLHHMTYKRLGNERLNDLSLTCPDCHLLIHKTHAQNLAWARRTGANCSIKKTSKKLRKIFLEKRKESILVENDGREAALANFATKLSKINKALLDARIRKSISVHGGRDE